MSTAARDLLAALETLPDAEREAVVTELLTRHPVGGGGIPDDAFTALADELFQSYDAAEAADAAPAR